MLGAIIGDIVGSRFEFDNIKTKEFDFFCPECFPTDDSIMTLALGKAILEADGDWKDLGDKAVVWMRKLGREYPDAGYGGRFWDWLFGSDPRPYGSFGNGSAMRVSGAGYAAKSLEEAKLLSSKITGVTHNHPEGLKGAEATAVAIFLARSGIDKETIKEYIDRNYYRMDFTLDEIRPTYEFNEICQTTVPEALMAFFESTDFEDAIRNAISIGGDSDTLGAICGSVAEAYYGIPDEIKDKALSFLDDDLVHILREFESKYPS